MSLLELLIAILTVSVLTALIFPAFAKVQQKSRAAACLSNLRQIGVGLTAYTTEKGRTVMACKDDLTWGELLGQWNNEFLSMRGKPGNSAAVNKVWQCPENRDQTRGVGAGEAKKNETSYTINGWTTSEDVVEFRYTNKPLAALISPSKLYAVTEGTYYRSQPEVENGAGTIPEDIYKGAGIANGRYAHNGAMNVLFADGHAELVMGPVAGRGSVILSGENRAEKFSNGIHWYSK